MPEAAGEHEFLDPSDPEAAIPKAAELLAELDGRFGSLGLPAETHHHVLAVTRRPVEDWKGALPAAGRDASAPASCPGELALVRASRPALAEGSALLAGSFSKAAAVAAYAGRRAAFAAVLRDEPPMVVGGRAPGRGFRPFYRVRSPAPSRSSASALCDRIMRLGGACSVSKS